MQGKNVEILHAVEDLIKIIRAHPLYDHLEVVSEEEVTKLKKHYNHFMYQAREGLLDFLLSAVTTPKPLSPILSSASGLKPGWLLFSILPCAVLFTEKGRAVGSKLVIERWFRYFFGTKVSRTWIGARNQTWSNSFSIVSAGLIDGGCLHQSLDAFLRLTVVPLDP